MQLALLVITKAINLYYYLTTKTGKQIYTPIEIRTYKRVFLWQFSQKVLISQQLALNLRFNVIRKYVNFNGPGIVKTKTVYYQVLLQKVWRTTVSLSGSW